MDVKRAVRGFKPRDERVSLRIFEYMLYTIGVDPDKVTPRKAYELFVVHTAMKKAESEAMKSGS